MKITVMLRMEGKWAIGYLITLVFIGMPRVVVLLCDDSNKLEWSSFIISLTTYGS